MRQRRGKTPPSTSLLLKSLGAGFSRGREEFAELTGCLTLLLREQGELLYQFQKEAHIQTYVLERSRRASRPIEQNETLLRSR